MAIKYKTILDTTDNSRIYKLALKRHREHCGDISCAWCPYHRKENGWSWFLQRNWKSYRKTQYKKPVAA